MSSRAGSTNPARSRLRVPALADVSIGDLVLRGLCVLAGLTAGAILVDVAYQMIDGARPAIAKFGLGFIGHTVWEPNLGKFGAATMLFGTGVTSLIALLIAAPVAIAIAVYLAILAPRSVRAIVGPLVEMLAAIPSVIVGFWGIVVLAPFMQAHVEPLLHDVLGFLPIFGPPQTTGLSVFSAGVVLAVMVVPIVAALSRDLFLTVPRELTDGAEALGSTRWEVIRGVVVPSTFSGVIAAIMLGLGRALGEAIAVLSLIGDGNLIHTSLFETGNSAAARIANDIQFVVSKLHTAALFYLALILLVIAVVTNLIARAISTRFDVSRQL